jgi:hypothetical protein
MRNELRTSHPTLEQLDDFMQAQAVTTPDDSAHRRIAKHVQECGKCSGYVNEARRLFAEIPDFLNAPPTAKETAETEEGWRRLQRKIATRRILERAGAIPSDDPQAMNRRSTESTFGKWQHS